MGYASLSRTMFLGMQYEYNRLQEEHDEAMRAANRYCDEAHHRKDKLKRATEVLTECRQSLRAAEKEKEYTGRDRDWARADIE